MDFGLFCLMPQRDPDKAAGQIAREAIEQAKLAEDIGLKTVWFAEHHFSNYSMIPSPLLMATYAAAQTKRIKIGTGVLVLPLYEPTRLIEEIAFVDQISNGRLYLGLGSGYQDYEFSRMGRNLAESQSTFMEFLEIIEDAFDKGVIEHQGEHFNLASAPLGIRPVQKPLPKIFIAGQLQNETVQAKIAKNGYVPFIAQHHRPASALIEQRQRLEKIWQASGKHSGDLQMATQRFVFVTKNKEEEMEAAEHIRYTLRIALGLRFGTATLSGSTLNEVPAPNEPSLEDILQTAPIGSPERVAEVLSNDISTIKPSQISFIAQFGGMEQDKAMRSLDLFGSEVLPLLRKEHGDLKEKDAVSAA